MSPSMAALMLALFAPPHGDPGKRAEDAFEAGEYELAAKAAAEAYALHGDPLYLYVQAQAERFGGHCEQANIHYREYLKSSPTPAPAQAARDNIAECEAKLAAAEPEAPEPASPQPEPAEPAQPAEPQAAPTPSDEPRELARPWFRDPWGGVLVGLGVVSLGVGAGIYGQARADERAADRATDVVTYGERIDRAFVLSRVGVPVLITGGVLVAAGVVRWIVVGRRGSRVPTGAVAVQVHGLTLRF